MYMIHRDATETQIIGQTLFEGLTDVDYDCLCVLFHSVQLSRLSLSEAGL